MFIYKDHLNGDFYCTDEEQDYEMLYCETCGDTDDFIGEAYTRSEAWKHLNEWKRFYVIEYLRSFVKENFKRK